MKYKHKQIMKYEHKQIMVKVMILVSCIWCILTCIITYILEYKPILNADYYLIFNLTILFYIICACTTVIASILYYKIGIDPPLTKAEQRKILARSFETLQNSLEEELPNQGFEKVEEFRKDNYYMAFYLKTIFDRVYLFALVQTNSLEPSIYNDSINQVNDYLTNNTKFVRLKEFYLIHCVCAERLSLEFDAMVNMNIEQDLDLFQLPVGILMYESKAYLAVQKGGFAITKYKHLRKLFLKLMKNQWDT